MKALAKIFAGFLKLISLFSSRLLYRKKETVNQPWFRERVSLLERLRDTSEDLGTADFELSAEGRKQRPVQARIYIASARVIKTIADTLCIHLVTRSLRRQTHRSSPFMHIRRKVPVKSDWVALIERTTSLYRDVLALIEKARGETGLFSFPVPFVRYEFIGPFELGADDLFVLREAEQNLNEIYSTDLKLASGSQRKLLALAARLRIKTATIEAIISEVPRRAPELLWTSRLYNEIFLLWLLAAQEIESPGITRSVSLSSASLNPADIFLMTDPIARARYEREGTLSLLENDIRYEVMREQPWQEQDLDYLRQVKILEVRRIIHRLASFWSISPHQSVYRALKRGEFCLAGKSCRFKKGQDIVWACPMMRDLAGIDVPVLIGNFQSQRIGKLCGQMRNSMLGRRVSLSSLGEQKEDACREDHYEKR